MSIFRPIAQRLMALCLAGLVSVAAAVEAPVPSSSITTPPPGKVTELQGVSVSGVQPGPGLW